MGRRRSLLCFPHTINVFRCRSYIDIVSVHGEEQELYCIMFVNLLKTLILYSAYTTTPLHHPSTQGIHLQLIMLPLAHILVDLLLIPLHTRLLQRLAQLVLRRPTSAMRFDLRPTALDLFTLLLGLRLRIGLLCIGLGFLGCDRGLGWLPRGRSLGLLGLRLLGFRLRGALGLRGLEVLHFLHHHFHGVGVELLFVDFEFFNGKDRVFVGLELVLLGASL